MEKRFENPCVTAGLSLTTSTVGDKIAKTAWVVALPNRMEKADSVFREGFERGSD